MKMKITLLALLLTLCSVAVWAQTPSASQSATVPDPQTAPQRSDNSAGEGNIQATAPAASDQGSAALQARIREALRNEPALSSSHVTVNVTDNTIDLGGTVGSSKDKLTAERIAQSFDGNRQLKDNLTVTGHGHSDMAPDHPAMNNGGTGNAPNPATNGSSTTPPQ